MKTFLLCVCVCVHVLYLFRKPAWQAEIEPSTSWRSSRPGQIGFDYENLHRAVRHVGREMASGGYVAHPAAPQASAFVLLH